MQMDSTISQADVIHGDFSSVACAHSCVYFILCHCITHTWVPVSTPKSRDKNLHHEIPGALLLREPLPPASLAHSPACGILSFVCEFLKFLLSFHDYPASTLVPRTLWFKLLAAIKVLTESCRQRLRIFCLWNWPKLENAWGVKSNLTILLLISSLFQMYKSKDYAKLNI